GGVEWYDSWAASLINNARVEFSIGQVSGEIGQNHKNCHQEESGLCNWIILPGNSENQLTPDPRPGKDNLYHHDPGDGLGESRKEPRDERQERVASGVPGNAAVRHAL